MKPLKFNNPVSEHVHGTIDLGDALTNKSPQVRTMARLIATGFPELAAAWATAEQHRGTDGHEILQALARIQVQIYASIVGCMVREEGHRAAIAAFSEVLAAEGVSHAVRAHRAVEEEWAKGGGQ